MNHSADVAALAITDEVHRKLRCWRLAPMRDFAIKVTGNQIVNVNA